MFEHQGIWLPDGEKHFPEWMSKNGEIVKGRGTYQHRKWLACIPWIRNWRTAVDVGGHVGLWSMRLVERFHEVQAFEPMPQFRECYMRNVTLFHGWCPQRQHPWLGDHSTHSYDEAHHAYLYGAALGATTGGYVRMNYAPADSGNTHVGELVSEPGECNAGLATLDSFGFKHVDFIKIDCEGYEHHVIEGARETIARCRPCVIVEQKQHKMAQNYGTQGTPAVDLLVAMGAKQRAVLSGDHILSFD